MRSYILDTHFLLWSLSDTQKLSPPVLSILENPANQIYFSQLSLIEISIKLKVGKINLLSTIDKLYSEAIEKASFIFLPIANEHIFSYQNLPLYEQHRDPFDRLLIATAIQENMTIITADEKFKLYEGLVEIIS